MIKALNKLKLEGNYLNIIKATYEKPTANIILQQDQEQSNSLFNNIPEVLARAIREEKEIKGILIQKDIK